MNGSMVLTLNNIPKKAKGLPKTGSTNLFLYDIHRYGINSK